jgi:hypothetical protein
MVLKTLQFKERWNGRDDSPNQIILLTACQSLITLKNITPKIIFHVIETEQSRLRNPKCIQLPLYRDILTLEQTRHPPYLTLRLA